MKKKRKKNVHAGVGAGKGRDPWAIREFLDGEGTNMTAEAAKIGVSPQIFQLTVKGVRNSRTVLSHLLKIGCPPELLSLPEDMKEEAQS